MTEVHLPECPGTYVLVFQAAMAWRLEVGRLGEIALETGYYLYVGSAFGPGGLAARIQRHWRREKRLHWHMDYLRPWLQPLEVWIDMSDQRLEHQWARRLLADIRFKPVTGFGCSDCDCQAHLFHTIDLPDPGCLQQPVEVSPFPG